MKMIQKPITFTTVFDVEEVHSFTVIQTPFGEVKCYEGDYIFTHPDGEKSKVSKENIKNFEVVE